MNKSESIVKIAPALLKAQKAIKAALKDANNPHFKSKYADLSSVIDAVKAPLNEAGITFLQGVEDAETGVAVETVLMHESGEWISSTIKIPASKQDAQGYGSATTYARRYGLQAMCGVPAEDDDGNAASKAPKGMPEGNLADHLSAIEGSASLTELQKTFTAAFKAAQAVSDTKAMEAITKAKDARKTAMVPA